MYIQERWKPAVVLTIYFLALVFPGLLTGQTVQLHGLFKRYSTQNGLSQNDIKCIFQDSFGYLWIGTNGGLNRFDGYSFKSYIRDQGDHYNLSSNLISSIAEDTLGNLWIGTDDMGIMLLHRKTDKFLHFKNNAQDPQLLTDNHVLRVLSDRSNNIWAITMNGINMISTQDIHQPGKVSIAKHYATDGDIFHCAIEDPKGNVWLGTREGLSRFSGLNKQGDLQFSQYENDLIRNVRHFSCNDTALFISFNGLFASMPYSSIDNEPQFNILRNNLGLVRHTSDRNGNIWYTDWNGAHVLFEKDGQLAVHHFTHDWSDPKSISSNITTYIMEDNNGMIWVGTNGGGLNLYNPKRRNFAHYKRNSAEGSISYNKIRSIEEDHLGNLWFGTEGGGLNLAVNNGQLDLASGFRSFMVNPNRENYVYAIEDATFKKRHRIFMGTGYVSYLEVLDRLPSGDYAKTVVDAIRPGSPVFDLFQDSEGALWLATYGNGVYHLAMDEYGEVLSYQNFSVEDGLSSKITRSIAEDNLGNIWVGTDKGISKIIGHSLKDAPIEIVTYQHNEKDSMSLGYDYVIPIYVSSKGEVWIGTSGGGLNKVIPGVEADQDRFQGITMKEGLPSNVIKSIEEDREGNLWLGTNKGLSKYNPVSGQIVNYGPSDGLQDMEFSEMASTVRSNGQMIFGGVNGFNTFFPDQLETDSTKVKLVFTDLTVLNQEIQVGREFNKRILLPDDINRLDKIHLDYDENSFSLSFSALSFISPENNKYAYKLENFDTDWINTRAENRIAKYTNLPAGSYTLKLKASNAGGHWNSKAKELTIIISPPIWNTLWAKAIYIVLILVGLWFFRKYTIITNTRKNQLLVEHIEKEKIEELSQLKLRFFTNISHEFRTPLMLILGLIDRLKDPKSQLTEEEKGKYYHKAYRNSRILLNLINQLLDFRKVEQGKMSVRVGYGNISKYIKLLADNFNELARKKNINYTFICKKGIHGYFDRDILERIIFNLLSNAFKFTETGDEITIRLVKEDENVYKLQVEDTGIGIPQEVQDHLFERFASTQARSEIGSGIGLSYTKGLVDLYHGSIAFVSKEKVGTKFTVLLPYSEDAFLEDIYLDEIDEVKEFSKDVNWILDDEGHDLDTGHKEALKKEYSILFVEDNKDILFYLQDHFKSTYAVHVAHDGEEALDVCLKEHIDLVVSDLMMPGMNGLEFCEKLKEDDRINHIPIILLTAKKTIDSKLKGYEKEADAYITKPFEMRELETRMQALITSRKKLLGKIRKNIDLKPSEVEISSRDERFLRRVMSYIEENIDMTEFTVDMLAKECGMSQLHLNKKLKVLVGQTANAFIRHIRIKRAAQLLTKEQYSVNEVMYEVGFIDPKYFRGCFKKEYGIAPSEYQKQHSLIGEQRSS